MRSAALLVVSLAAIVPRAGASETSLRCDGGIVSLGDRKLDLLSRCGQPTLEEPPAGVQIRVETPHAGPVSIVRTVVVERWSYDFGPQRFVAVVELRDGKLARVERGGYGYAGERAPLPATARARCDSSAIRVGDLKLDLLARCGAPAVVDVRQEQLVAPIEATACGERREVLASADVETWTYDFGPSLLTATATLVDGKVVRVERGGYGAGR